MDRITAIVPLEALADEVLRPYLLAVSTGVVVECAGSRLPPVPLVLKLLERIKEAAQAQNCDLHPCAAFLSVPLLTEIHQSQLPLAVEQALAAGTEQLRQRLLLEHLLEQEVQPGRPSAALASGVAGPITYLNGWREILEALGLKNDESIRRRVARLNTKWSGPIITRGQGCQPTCEKSKLLMWYQGLEEQYRRREQHARETRKTVEGGYTYGRDEKVIPGVAGHEKKRRRDHKA